MKRAHCIAASVCVCLSVAQGGPWSEAGRLGDFASAWADDGVAAGKGNANGVGNSNGGGNGNGTTNGRGRGNDNGIGTSNGRGRSNDNGNGSSNGRGRGNDNGNGSSNGRGRGNDSGNGNAAGPGNGRGIGHGAADANRGGRGDGRPGRSGISPPGHATAAAATSGAAPALAAAPPAPAPPALDGGGAEADEILALDLSQADADLARAAGFAVGASERLDALDLHVTALQIPPGTSPRQALRALSVQAPQAMLALNTRYALAGESCASDKCYGQVLIGWRGDEPGSCGRPVRLGMIDTPVDVDSPRLARQRLHTRSFVGSRELAPDTHGTAVATLLIGNRSAQFSGLLPNASLFAANAFYRTGDGEVTTNARFLLAALDWLMQQGVELVNLSFSGPPNPLLERALAKTEAHGAIAVAAAGNAGAAAPPAFPAAYPTVIAVTALDRYYRPYAWANRGEYVAFAAPGVDIWTPDRSAAGAYHSGTSFAAAFASGIVADLLARAPAARADIEQSLRTLTRDLGATGRDPVYGWGLLRGESNCPRYAVAD